MAKTRLTTGREANPNVAAKLAGSNRQSTGGGPINIAPKVTSPPLGGPSTNPKQDKNRGNRIASALGRASAAVIGDPTHPFAQIGNLIAGEAEQDIFSSTVSDLLEGKGIDQVDTRGLSPEQISEALRLKKEGQATKLGTSKEVLSQLKQIASLEGLSPEQRTLLSKNVFTAAGLEVDEAAIEAAGSLETPGETQEKLIKTEGEQQRFAQYQGAQQDLELIRTKGGLDMALQTLRNEGDLDVAAIGAISRQLGIETDIAGKAAAELLKTGKNPEFQRNIATALAIQAGLPTNPNFPPSPEESLATLAGILMSLGETDFADALSAPVVTGVEDPIAEDIARLNKGGSSNRTGGIK